MVTWNMLLGAFLPPFLNVEIARDAEVVMLPPEELEFNRLELLDVAVMFNPAAAIWFQKPHRV